ncbi:uncharacterized protein LOC113315473 [Papaver somniferum]|uniref:uncharacterized protein LOC113315473 n=1 Tax=Papaver somniferum TaxID=3469 RepID=UPI000E6FEA48|nr:uncharacterized protein LOC113315473 [Papaver somniferum]
MFPEGISFEQVDPYNLVKGSKFVSKNAFKKHLRAYCVKHRHQVKFKDSNNYKIRVNWNVKHTCNGNIKGENRCANPEFVADWYMHRLETLGSKNKIPDPESLANEFNKTIKVNIKYHTAWRARNIVLQKLHGSYEEQYKKIPAFCEMVKEKMPGSVASFSYGSTDNTFLSMTLCFKPAIEGFLDGCRKIIGLDACHLYGKYGGVLLVATGLDGQNGLVPLGIMVCRNETIENWKIFLKDLKAILGEDLYFTIISDKQKGISEACDKYFCLDEHILCFRHLMKNFKKYFKSYSLHVHFWNAAKCYKKRHYQQHMDKLFVEDEKAALYLIDQKPENWSRSHFSNDSKCEHINNNFSESFNNMAKPFRDKPIITLAQMYNKLVMGLFFKRRNESWQDGEIVPKAMKLITKMQDLNHLFELTGAVRGRVYEVRSVHDAAFVVDLSKKRCSCLQWQLRGFLCQHVIVALTPLRPNWVDYCDPVYSVEYYKKTYAPEFEPLSAEIDWNILVEFINPPVIIRKTGRPRKKRIPSYDEAGSVKKMRKCKKCGVYGHYAITCAGGEVGKNPKGEKPRTCVDGSTSSTHVPEPPKRKYNRKKPVVSASAGASTTAKDGMKNQNNSESSKQGAAKGRKRKASSQPAFNQTNQHVGSVNNKVTFTVADPKGKKKPKKYMKV